MVNHLVRPAPSVTPLISNATRLLALGLGVLGLLATPSRALAQQPAAAVKTGVLLLAHGGSASWNDRVTALAGKVSEKRPVEVAFGMASRPNIQTAVDKLVAAGVTEIVAVPLFVSDHSSVVTSTAYLLGVREEMPEDLKMFAKMNHGHGGGHGAPAAQPPATQGAQATQTAHSGHAGHGTAAAAPAPAPAQDNTARINSPVPIRMTGALGRHPLVGEILATRAQSISKDAPNEAVILVAHGPVRDDENKRWVDDMLTLAQGVRSAAPFASVDALTVRDDADKPVRDAATAELRALVEKRTSEKKRVLLVPVLMSYGGIERGIKKRLEGLEYSMPENGLAPDDRLVTWVLEMASTPARAASSPSSH
jgi:sirohydrochlorin ferrochelatase